MNIVIIGAGSIGLHIASLLSQQGHSVTLIDQNGAKLEESSWQADIATREGSGTDWHLLEELLELKPDLFMALTNQDEVNLVACSLAKQLGYPRTIARVKNPYFLDGSRLNFNQLFQIDYLISPELLVAYEIYKHLISAGTLAFESFVHGAVQMKTIQIPAHWKQDSPLSQIQLPKGLIVGLIRRPDKVRNIHHMIFPRGDDRILPEDEVTLIGEREPIANIDHLFGINQDKLDSVVIVGGSLVGINLAKILSERKVHVRLIDKDYQKCLFLAEELPSCRIIQNEGTDLDFITSEKMNDSDYFVLCTNNDEVNVLGALVAKEAGCKHVGIVLTNDRFVPLVNRLGIIHVVSPKRAAADHILSLTTSKAISSLVFLYSNQVEILEMTVSSESKAVGIPLANLRSQLPQKFLITSIQNKGHVTVPKGDSIIQAGDTIIAICHADAFQEIRDIF